MAQPYVGEIRMFAGNFEISGWKFCSGQLLPISEYETLFNLIGTTYGGDGQNTFALPDLQSRVPIHFGNNGTSTYTLAQNGGVETVTLSTSQIPAHTHSFLASTDAGGAVSPNGAVVGVETNVKVFRPQPAAAPLNAGAIGSQGGSQPHENLQPLLCVNFIISLFGIYPSQT
jgi:microcystin-dependent protein